MKKPLTLGFSTSIVVAFISVGLSILSSFVPQDQNALGAYNSPSNQASASSGVQSTSSNSSSILLSVKQVAGDYKWINATSGTENPELTLKTNENNTIKIQNPTDTKHELIIDLQGKEVASSGDVAPSASGQVSFRPNGTGTFSYHCQYHPDTMKGTIKLSGS